MMQPEVSRLPIQENAIVSSIRRSFSEVDSSTRSMAN